MLPPRSSENAQLVHALGELPAEIQDKLRALVGRVRRIQVLRGILATLAVALIATIVLIALGAAFVILSPALNAALSALGLAAVVACAYQTLYRPLRKPLPAIRMARIIEARHPELHERISTAIELLADEGDSATHGSNQLLAKVVESAAADAQSFRPELEFTNRTSRRYLIALAAAAAVLAAVYLIAPAPAGRLLTRVVAPFTKVGNAYAERLLVEPGDSRVAEGDPLSVRVAVDGVDVQRAEILRSSRGEPETVESLTLVGRDGAAGTTQFGITFPAINQDFSYRIRSGRAVSASYDVTAAQRPEIRRLELSYEFPSYTGLPPLVRTGLEQSIEAVTATKVRVQAHFDRPLDSAVLRIDGNPMPASSDHSGELANPRAAWEFNLAAGTEGMWRIDLIDMESVSNRAAESPIRAIPDHAPSIRLIGGQGEVRARPDETLTFRYEVDEDFGLAAASLRVSGLGDELPQPLPARSGGGRYTGAAVLDLADIPVSGGATPVQVFVVVEDNHPDSQAAVAGPIAIMIDPETGSLAEQAVDRQRAELGGSIASAVEKLQLARGLVEPIPGQLVKADQFPLALLEELDRIRGLIGEAESLVHACVAEAASPASFFGNLEPGLASLNADHLVRARQSVEEVPLSDSKVTRVHRAHTVARQLDEGIADLEVALRELKQQSAQAKTVAKIGNLSQKQRRLADAIAAANDPSDRNELREQQTALAAALEQLIDEGRRPLSDHLQDARHDAATLAEFAGSLARKQAALIGLLDSAADPGDRDGLWGALLIALEAEQREIGDALAGSHAALRGRAESTANAIAAREIEEAARVGRGLGQSLAGLAVPAEPRDRIAALVDLQSSIADQLEALLDGELEQALALRQRLMATRADELVQRTQRFRQQAGPLAAPSALQQLDGAGAHAERAARSARLASAQLEGGASSGAFEFAQSPDDVSPDPPRSGPTQAGVDGTSHPGESVENPFSSGAADTGPAPPEPPKISGATGGGAQLPEELVQRPPAPELSTRLLPASGESSSASAAKQPARQAQREFAGVGDALADAAGSLAQQAGRPAAQPPEGINQQMLEAALDAARLALEQDPEALGELAAKLAEAFPLPAPSAMDTSPAPPVTDWQAIRGTIRSGVSSARKGATPDGYRNLINSYFKEIARLSNESSSPER